jgi:alpha-glucosidase (family GH31 glycosyl hydrolase)
MENMTHAMLLRAPNMQKRLNSLIQNRVPAAFVLLLVVVPFLTVPPLNAAPEPQPPGLYDPVADPHAVVTLGHARFTVLTSQLVRMEWSADGKFEDHASLVFLNRKLPVPHFTAASSRTTYGEHLLIETSQLKLTYSPRVGTDGKFDAGNLQVQVAFHGAAVTWKPGDADTGNLMGTARTLDGSHGGTLSSASPMEPGLISRNGWVVVDDSSRPLFDAANFSFTQGEQSEWPWVMLRPAGDHQDWYFFGYGHDYKQALADYVKVAGRIPLPPRFAFGAWWSRYWAYTDQELDTLVAGFHHNDVPLDVLVIDMDWHPTFPAEHGHEDKSGQTLGWTGYTWNPLLFPSPELFLNHIHRQNLEVTLNLHPASGVQPWEAAYPAMARAMGIDPATSQDVPFDPTNKHFATTYMDIVLHPLERQGVNFWWLDWQQELPTKIPELNNVWWLSYLFFTDQARQHKRPIMLNRWGGLGAHRYQIGFSGDTISSWPALAFQTWFTATAANVGFAYWSHDIGGHAPGPVPPELFTRWVQFAVFSPILRTHTTKNSDAERRIWAYPEPYSDIMRRDFDQRYALVPYIYTEARRTYDTGLAFLRPLYYDWPDFDQVYDARDEYSFGNSLIAAPVVTPVDQATDLAHETLWVPPGEWMDWQRGLHLRGPATIGANYSISQIPVLVRAGAIIPMTPGIASTSQEPAAPLAVVVFPLAAGEHSAYRLYEDASNTPAYQSNVAPRAFAWTNISAAEQASDLSIEIAPIDGSYPGMAAARAYQVRLPADWPPDSVSVNGHPLQYSPAKGATGWRYEGNTLTTVIDIPQRSVHDRTIVRIHRAPMLFARRPELDGFAGAMTRLQEIYDALNHTWPTGWAPDDLIDAMQTGDRISYKPSTAPSELARFHQKLPQAIDEVLALHPWTSQEQQDVAARYHWPPSTAQEQAETYKQLILKAQAAVHDMQAMLSHTTAAKGL